ncbi:MAG: efflux RND transporter permease subunit [Chloroflexi bacterium]|nr:efflux RND transporter permease subunit [Chloroflexota bacterium]
MVTRFFEGMGAVAAKFWPAVFLFWLIIAGVVWHFAPPLEDVTKSGDVALLPNSAESVQAEDVLSKDFAQGDTSNVAFIVISRTGGLWPEDKYYVEQVTNWLRSPQAPKELSGVLSPIDSANLQAMLSSKDGQAELVRITFSTSPWQPATGRAIAAIRDHIEGTPEGLSAHLSGSAAIYSDTKTAIQTSVDRTGPLTIALVVLILLIIYRSPVAPVVPLVTIGVSYFISRNLIAITGQFINVSSLVETFLIAVLFGAGTDYCLFLISRYREELAAGNSPRQATARTMGVIGEAISSSAATVIAGLGAMAFAVFGLFNSLGPSIAIGVFVTLLAALTLIPALMAALRERMFWPLRPSQGGSSGRFSPWPRISGLVVRFPAQVLVIGFVVLVGLSLGFTGLVRDYDLLAGLPKDSDSIAGMDAMTAHFGSGSTLPVTIIVDKGQQIFPSLRDIYKLTGALQGTAGVSEVKSPMAPDGELLAATVLQATPQQLSVTNPPMAQAIGSYLSKDYTEARIDVALQAEPYSNQALDFLPTLKDKVENALQGTSLQDAKVYYGGATAITADLRDITNVDTVRVTAIVLAAIFIILALLLRSMVAPVYLVLTIVLSYLATLGVVTLVIQGLQGETGIDWSLPFIVFIMLFALGEDYNIFLMSRVKEEVGHRGDGEGIRRAVERTGGIITSCGIIMIGTFGILLLSPVRTTAQTGLAIAIGIFFDTFIVRTILVPSIARLLGQWSWWPRRRAGSERPFYLRQLPRPGV